MKNRILLENYYLPDDLETQVEAFVEYYNHQRYHESLKNVTPADAYFGRTETIIKQRSTSLTLLLIIYLAFESFLVANI